jgi:hypothetical protein
MAEVPLNVVTLTSTVPTACAGLTATIEVSELTTKLAAGTVPNETLYVPVKFVPVIVTDVLPAVLPVEGLNPVTVGEEATTNATTTSVTFVALYRTSNREVPNCKPVTV